MFFLLLTRPHFSSHIFIPRVKPLALQPRVQASRIWSCVAPRAVCRQLRTSQVLSVLCKPNVLSSLARLILPYWKNVINASRRSFKKKCKLVLPWPGRERNVGVRRFSFHIFTGETKRIKFLRKVTCRVIMIVIIFIEEINFTDKWFTKESSKIKIEQKGKI